MAEYYILSLKWTRRDDCITWWGPNDSGYTWILAQAGRYSAESVDGNRAYYDNRESTVAIPCEIAERYASRVVLHGSNHAMLSEVFGNATMVGSTVDDVDHEGRDQCPGCERGYGRPGPSRLIVHEASQAMTRSGDSRSLGATPRRPRRLLARETPRDDPEQ